jgi:NAD(P)-dependent dehydrogenase (short-subunit alcohol dehydrogenase family)
MSFQNKTAIITGGASGIGFGCGMSLAKDGAKVVLVDINKEALEKAVEQIKKEANTETVMGCNIDITKYDQVKWTCDETIKAFETIDIMISCAGGAECRLCNNHAEFKDLPIEVVDFGIDVNLKGAIYFDHAVMGQMAKQKSGVIVHLGSITGQEGCPSNIAYSATKSALMNGATKSIALAGAPYNVRCFCVAPGPVLTRPGMASMKTLLGRAAETHEIVDMILYLASDKGAFVTGTTLLMDGGRDILRNK